MQDRKDEIVAGPFSTKIAAERSIKMVAHSNRQGLRIEVEPGDEVVAMVNQQIQRAYEELFDA